MFTWSGWVKKSDVKKENIIAVIHWYCLSLPKDIPSPNTIKAPPPIAPNVIIQAISLPGEGQPLSLLCIRYILLFLQFWKSLCINDGCQILILIHNSYLSSNSVALTVPGYLSSGRFILPSSFAINQLIFIHNCKPNISYYQSMLRKGNY